ncbi:hypothetical protein HYH02_009318 [Chlamydomonas schloesseri]|uniref:Uncharacterized protein n=1 Tax=Chlamydomonas schloesseri TaxID=2026947 RepID=A0A835W887_9CHLO|nr:hypothetical protein HYH02_009318 [Chlamydomonas schloesseri]|eukprot:KAG2443245.1 hypothetical protein HYH02_009318 [Chlamydomonas schloesseri]
MAHTKPRLNIGTISEQQVPASVLQSPGRQLRHHHSCSVHGLCALCQETAAHFQYAELQLEATSPGVPGGSQPESTRVPAHDVWHLLLESPLAHTSVTLRQRLHLRSLVLPPPSALHPAEAPAQLLVRKGVWLWRDQADVTPPSASGTATPTSAASAAAAAVPGYEDTPPDRIRRALNGEGAGPSRLGPCDHMRRLFACRDALLAAAEHGDTDALTLLVRHPVFRSYAFGPHAAVSRDVLLTDLIWGFCGGRVAPDLLGWMFEHAAQSQEEAESSAPFAEWRHSDVPYLAAAIHLHAAAAAAGPAAGPAGAPAGRQQGGAAAGAAASGAGAGGGGCKGAREHYDAEGSPLLALQKLGFHFHKSGRTFLLAVWLCLHDRCSEAAIKWLAAQGCPTGPPGWAYALVAGLQPSCEWSDRQAAVLAALAAAHVALGPAALADLWRLGPEPFSSYVGFLARQRCPGLQPPHHRLYAAAACSSPSVPASRAEARARCRFLERAGLAPPLSHRLCGVCCASPPAADGFAAAGAGWDDAGDGDANERGSGGGTRTSNGGAPVYGSRDVTAPLLALLEGVPAECLVVGGPAASQSNVAGALNAALTDLQQQEAMTSSGGGGGGSCSGAAPASTAAALHARQLRQQLQQHLQRRCEGGAHGVGSSQSEAADMFSSGGSEAMRSEPLRGENEGEGPEAGGAADGGEADDVEPVAPVTLERHNASCRYADAGIRFR